MPVITRALSHLVRLEAAGLDVQTINAVCDALDALDLTDHRGCYTCASSPPAPRPGCDRLTFEEALDMPIIDYCEASGVNDEASPTRGFPTDLSVACPRWRARTA